MPDLFVRFDSWSAGNAGRLDPGMAPQNAWYGRNVHMYNSGLIGPRWGLKSLAVTVSGGGSITVPVANGPKGFATLGSNALVTADKTYMIPLTGLEAGAGVATPFAAYPVTPSKWVTYVAQTDSMIFALVDNALYRHNTSGMTTTAVTTPSPFSFIRRWNLYCVGVDSVTPYRLWFSQITSGGFDFSVWPVGNYLDVGDSEPITAIVPVYNTLFVGKRSGWWAITGVIGTSSAIRQATSGDGPVDARGAGATADNRIVYWPRSYNPALFNGSRSSLLLDHVVPTFNPLAAQAVMAAPTGRTNIFGYDNGATSSVILFAEAGGASYHDLGVTLAGYAPDVIENGYGISTPGTILAAKKSTTAGETLQLYAWNIDADRPPIASDTLGSLGDGVNTPVDAYLQTRAWFDPQGRDVRVRSVQVRYRAWKIGSNATEASKLMSGFGISVETLSPYDDRSSTSPEQHARVAWNEVSTSGSDLIARFAIGDQGFGSGFRINVTDMRGIAIRDIVVGLDVRSQRT